MRKYLILLVCVIALMGCVQTAKVVCNAPYIMVGSTCCLDKDTNGVCDKDEAGGARADDCPEPVFDCDSCPPKIVSETEEVEVVRYVCPDGETIVDDVADCARNAEPEILFSPITTNEDGQVVIKEFRVRPACRGGYNAIEVYFDVGTAANDVTLQFKDHPDARWSEAFEFSSPIFQKYLYGVFCNNKCTSTADFYLEPGKKYLFRGMFDYSQTSWEDVFYSNEHVIDATEDGEYATKLC